MEHSTKTSGKRKSKEDTRLFNSDWTEKYFFIECDGKSICMICNEAISAKKEYNLKRHYESKHPTYSKLVGLQRSEKLTKLSGNLKKQQHSINKGTAESENNTKVSYLISSMIAKRMKPFTDGEFVKECITVAIDSICPEKRHLIDNISLSARTVTRRVEDMSSDIEENLKRGIEDCEYFSIALDESTDISDTAQLAIFIRFIDNNFKITE